MNTNRFKSTVRLWSAVALACFLTGGGVLRANLTLLVAGPAPVESGDDAILAEAVSAAASEIEALATRDPESFGRVLRQAFGSRLIPEVELHLVELAALRQLPLPGRICFTTEEALGGAYAAYSNEGGGIIFLNASYRTDPEALTTFLLHEWAHHLDALLGEGDAPFDEGRLFVLGIEHGGDIPAAFTYLAGARADDHRVIVFEGRTLVVECFWGKIWSGIKSVGNAINDHVIKPVGNVLEAAGNTVVDLGKKGVSFLGNAGQAIGNLGAGLAAGVASGLAHMTGNSELGDKIAAESRKQFSGAFGSLKGAANDAVGGVASLGDLYNKTTVELNKVVPHLGTIAGVAAGFTPAGPALALTKGVADVKNVIENGGDAGAIAGAVGFAVLDFGGAKLGRVAGGIKGAKGAATVSRARGGTVLSTPGFFSRVKDGVSSGIGKVKGFGGTVKGATTGSWKYTKVTAGEIATGGNLINNWPKTTAVIGVLDKIKSADTLIRSKDFIPGQDRDENGRKLGTGNSNWQNHVNSVEDLAVTNWNKARELAGGGMVQSTTPVTTIPITSTTAFKGIIDTLRRLPTGPTSLTNTGVGGGAPAPVVPLWGWVTGQDVRGIFAGYLSGAKIEVFRADRSLAGSSTTDESGFFHFGGLTAGSYTYRASGSGFQTDDRGRPLVIPPGSEGEVFNVTLSGTQATNLVTGRLAGRIVEVKDGKRLPLSTSSVTAVRVTDGEKRVIYSDKNGEYLLHLSPGSWKVAASAIGRETSLYPGEVKIQHNLRARADFEFASTGNMGPVSERKVLAFVQVPRISSGPMPVVRFISENTGVTTPGRVYYGAVPFAAGTEFFNAIPTTPLKAGTYRVEGELAGFSHGKSEPMSVVDNGSTNFQLDFVAAKAPTPGDWPEVQIYTRSKADWIDGVNVTLVKKNPGAGQGKLVTLTTRNKGTAITRLEDGKGAYTYVVTATGYQEQRGGLVIDEASQSLTLNLVPLPAAEPKPGPADDFTKKILTEGWGNLLASRQFHESGTKAAPADGRVDFALGLSALKANDKATAIPAFALSVSKVSNETWWDRACEAHLWTLMHHRETTSAVAEIRRIFPAIYGSRAKSDQSEDTAFFCGLVVGVLKGPWATDATKPDYDRLDTEVTAVLKNSLLTSYEAGKAIVTERFTQLSGAETKARQDLANASQAERNRLIADLEARNRQLQGGLDANSAQQQTQNQRFTDFRTNAETQANAHNARLTDLAAQAEVLRKEVADLQEKMANGMQAQTNRRLEELQGGLNASLASQENETRNFTTYRNDAEQTANGYVNRLTEISAELQTLAAQIAQASANPDPSMSGNALARRNQIEQELGAIANQAAQLSQGINARQEEAQGQINTYNGQLQKIVDDQTARQNRVNDLNALPPYCPVCINFAEKPADCADCAKLRSDREAEINGLIEAFNQDQAREGEIRGLLEGVQNNYNAAVAAYNEQITPMQTRETTLREEYNRLADELNKGPAPNPMNADLRNRDAALRAEYQQIEAKHKALTDEYGKAEAEYLALMNRLKETETSLRADLANLPASTPGSGAEAGLITEKTAAYTRLQQEYQDEEKKLAAVQANYLAEGGKFQQEIAKLTEVGTTLANQINENAVKMASQPQPDATPGNAPTAEDRPSMVFSTYFDYPVEQRRRELLDQLTRGVNLATPGTR